ncbi:MAG: copper resistance CopC family protein [Xanthobacteraceae bacterium]
MKKYLLITALFCLTFETQVVHAHATLDHASPRVGSVIARAPAEVRLWFTQKLTPRLSGIEVSDAGGAKIAAGGSVEHGSELTLRLPALKPGVYRVKWHVLSVDAHQTDGDFSFEIKQ